MNEESYEQLTTDEKRALLVTKCEELKALAMALPHTPDGLKTLEEVVEGLEKFNEDLK